MEEPAVDRHPLSQRVEIRRATAADAVAISAILSESFKEFRKLYTADGYAATVLTPDAVRQRLGEGPVWVATAGVRIAGTVAVVERSAGLYIRGMAVSPAARGHGIAATLLREAELFGETANCTRLYLSTTPFLTGAIHLYESFGYRRTSEGPHDLHGTPLFTMAKKKRVP